MEELFYERIAAVLDQAHRIDQKCELFGASKHQYRLNPPIDETVVRAVEERYNFRLPEDYVCFITKIANGGAGPDYGIMPFEESLMTGAYNCFQEAYKRSLKKPFTPRRMMLEEVEKFSFFKAAYEQEPDKYFIYEKEDDDICGTDGFFLLGTRGCQWDFGLIVSGGRTGQVFDTDNEGAYAFTAHSFNEFYREWLDWLSDTENVQRELEKWRKLRLGRK
ncbi:SMI1/KNR4 family protein [Oscillibacter sp. 1-3]|uniref:SMI1/KNR4 family protein n=1 Tax=Oscillibacter sp. 1-3 TaxID=1235797 RepID=UPI0003A79AA0|nr:SMI1/KNR4 family protein [Oscillibacter sp. 1-3]